MLHHKYRRILGLVSEILALIHFSALGKLVIKWRARDLKGDLDILLFENKDLVGVEVKGITHDKDIFEVLKKKQLQALRKRIRSVVVSQGLYPRYVRLDLYLVQWCGVIPKIRWIKNLERIPIFQD